MRDDSRETPAAEEGGAPLGASPEDDESEVHSHGSPAASSSEDDDQPADPDVRTRLSQRQVAQLSETARAELRRVYPAMPSQKHFVDHSDSWERNSAATVHNWCAPQVHDVNTNWFQRRLDNLCDHVPTMRQFIDGMDLRNCNPDYLGQLRPVVRALDSKSQHYKNELQSRLAVSGAPPYPS